MQSLTVTVEGLRWGNSDTRDAMLGRALSYLVLFSTLGIVLRWSYGIKLLSTADEEGGKNDEESFDAGVAPNTIAPMREDREDEQLYNVDAPLLAIREEQQLQRAGGENGRFMNGQQPSPRRSRFSEAPATLGKPFIARPQAPIRRWTALGNREDSEHADFFHKSLQPNTKGFKREIAGFRSFPNTPSRTPAASSYASSASGSGTESNDGEQDGDTEDDFEGTGRTGRTLPSRTATQAWIRRNRRKCTVGFKAWIWKPIVHFLKGMQAFMTAPLYVFLVPSYIQCLLTQRLVGLHCSLSL